MELIERQNKILNDVERLLKIVDDIEDNIDENLIKQSWDYSKQAVRVKNECERIGLKNYHFVRSRSYYYERDLEYRANYLNAKVDQLCKSILLVKKKKKKIFFFLLTKFFFFFI